MARHVVKQGGKTDDWEGGMVSSHAELETADRRFWADAGASARVEASLVLAIETWRLAHPEWTSPAT